MPLIPPPDPVSKELQELIDKAKRDIAEAFRFEDKVVGKIKHPPSCECPDCNPM